ncbi:MAG: hypothetical protein CVU46_08955 [Chloroflexi bacterium HGW-Chloroflexi-8]|nr:MAG: hypothetical protein CVU46_08955 [Chloroflexi bacterium HGW-Chloroflexi-8]
MVFLTCTLNESILINSNYFEILRNHFPFIFEIPEDCNQSEFDELTKFFSEEISVILKNEIGLEKFHSTNIDQNFTFKISTKISTDIPPDTIPTNLSKFFRFNKWVKIRDEVFDYYLRIPISNFVGRIIDFYNDGDKDIFYIQWSCQSLDKISQQSIQKCLNKKISPFGTYISKDFILPINFSEPPFLIEKKQMDLLKPFFKNKFEDEYNSVFDNKNQDDFPYQIWERFLDNLFRTENNINLIKNKSEFRIVSIAGSDEKNGVWVEVMNTNQRFVAPLNSFLKIKTSLLIERFFVFYKYWSTYFCRD